MLFQAMAMSASRYLIRCIDLCQYRRDVAEQIFAGNAKKRVIN